MTSLDELELFTPVCDHHDLPLVNGWHTRPDPEGWEGEQRIPCPLVPVVSSPRRHRHMWVAQDKGHGVFWECMSCYRLRDEAKARRGKSSRRLGHDGERRSEKRYGWTKVGEFGGITDLQGTLAIVQQKTSRRAPPPAWQSIFRALEARAGGRIPLILLSFVKQGVPSTDYIVIRGDDWLAMHGKDEPPA